MGYLGRIGSGARSAQHRVCQGEFIPPGTRRRHSDHDPAHADPDQGPDLQQPEPERAAGGSGELRVRQADPAQRAHQHVGERREPQSQLIGPHGRRRGAVGKQVKLAFLDAVLHLARAQ